MAEAIKLAKKGEGKVAPNPLVGCVIVKRGQIVGRGYHKEYGGPHAEVVALEQARHKARDSILYVTLEPCSHWGKTPPCTEQIVDAGVREVVIGMKDPNHEVNGFEVLKLRGLKTRIGMLEEECKKLNEPYEKHSKKGLPLVILKAGMTLDGKIATSTGMSKYITGKESLRMVHKLRSDTGAVMVGINTIIKDDPRLDTRFIKGIEPVKLVIDTNLRIPIHANVLRSPKRLIIACSSRANALKKKRLGEIGVRFIQTETKSNLVNLRKVMMEMAKMGHQSILLEGGSELNAEMLKNRLVDKVMLFSSPKILGDDGIGVVGKIGIKELDKVINVKETNVKRVGKDILVEGRLK